MKMEMLWLKMEMRELKMEIWELTSNDEDVFALLDFTRCTIVCVFKPKCNS